MLRAKLVQIYPLTFTVLYHPESPLECSENSKVDQLVTFCENSVTQKQCGKLEYVKLEITSMSANKIINLLVLLKGEKFLYIIT